MLVGNGLLRLQLGLKGPGYPDLPLGNTQQEYSPPMGARENLFRRMPIQDFQLHGAGAAELIDLRREGEVKFSDGQ